MVYEGKPRALLRRRANDDFTVGMQLVHIYLNYDGTTEEAFTFYEKVFGTKIIMMQRYGETSFIPNVPDVVKNKIMHAQLPITESVHLMASDANCGFGDPLVVGNNFSVSIVARDKAEADRVYEMLAGDGGKARMPMGNAPWGPYFGMCTDRFGVQWMDSLTGPA